MNTSGENTDYGITLTCHQLTTWRDDGLFISADTIQCNNIDIDASEGLVANENGYIAASLTALAPVPFGNNVTADCYSPGLSSAVIALYHNPEFTQPYVGVPEYESDASEVVLYPNPATRELFVGCGESAAARIAILDMEGRVLWCQSASGNPIAVDVSNLPAGVYLLKYIDEKRTIYKKFVKSSL